MSHIFCIPTVVNLFLTVRNCKNILLYNAEYIIYLSSSISYNTECDAEKIHQNFVLVHYQIKSPDT